MVNKLREILEKHNKVDNFDNGNFAEDSIDTNQTLSAIQQELIMELPKKKDVQYQVDEPETQREKDYYGSGYNSCRSDMQSKIEVMGK